MNGGSRVLLRLARRSISKSPLRSLLVVVLITIVVAVGTGTAIAIRSATPTLQDQVDATFGSADTLIFVGPGNGPAGFAVPSPSQPPSLDGIYLSPDSPEYEAFQQDLRDQEQRGIEWVQGFNAAQTTASLEAGLGQSVLVSRHANVDAIGGPFRFRPSLGRVTDIDMTDPLASRYLDLIDGRFPESANEIAIAASRSNFVELAIGDQVTVHQATFDVVGLITKPSSRYDRTALVTPPGFDKLNTVPSSLVVELRTMFGNDQAREQSQGFIEDQLGWAEPVDLWSASDYGDPRGTNATIRVVPALISAVLGIQLALVAAAAFAVGIRRRTKEFGQLITTGMDGNQLRRMILFEAGWLGLAGAAAGIALGVVGVTQLINAGLLSEIGERYVDAPRWNVVDWLAPAGIGLAAALAAAWWPSRSLEKAPVTAALAGHLPAGRTDRATPKWGLLVVIAGALLVGSLASSASNNQGLGFSVIFVGAIATTFVGTLLFIGSMLAGINARSSRFPLLARLVVRSSERHRTRSWMVVGAFIATLALPVLVGSSVKAYPNSSQVTNEFDRRVLTVRNDAPELPLPENASPNVDWRSEVDQLHVDLDDMIAEFGPVESVPTSHTYRANLSIGNDHFRRGYGGGVTVLTPQLAQVLDLPAGLVAQVDADSVLYIGTNSLQIVDEDGAFLGIDQGIPGSPEVSVDVIQGPAISNYELTTLISPELAGRLSATPFLAPGTLHLFAEPLSESDEEALFDRANALWVERFQSYDPPSGSSLPTDDFLIQEWALRQTQMSLQQSYQSGPTQSQLQWGSIVLTGLLAALIALITASLAAVELDSELQSMVATGAPPRMRRMMLGAQTLYHLGLAAVLAIPLSLLLFYAVTRADDNGPAGPVFPWTSIGVSAVVIPLVVAAIVAAVFRNGRPAVSRRLS